MTFLGLAVSALGKANMMNAEEPIDAIMTAFCILRMSVIMNMAKAALAHW